MGPCFSVEIDSACRSSPSQPARSVGIRVTNPSMMEPLDDS